MEEFNSADVRARKKLHWQREKETKIIAALESDPVDIPALRELAVSLGGLLHSRIRKKAWPKLAGVNVFYISPYEGPPLSGHKDRSQILLDVNRCGKRIPKHFSEARHKQVQEQLTRVILRILADNPGLHYYQGLHDVAITFLLVAGEDIAYALMNVIVKHHIRDYLDVDMSRTKLIIGHIRSLLALEDPRLEQFIGRSECAYYFSLSWLITWYGHVVQRPDEACRLVDAFMASHPLMPVYVAAAIVLTRRSEVLSVECEMSAVHGLLSKLPENLKYEQMIMLASQLMEKHPPKTIAKYSGVRLSKSSLVSTYSSFLKATLYQRPDHILRTLPAPPPPSWWAWLTPPTSVVRYILSVTAPVLVAVVVYVLYGYLSDRTEGGGWGYSLSVDR